MANELERSLSLEKLGANVDLFMDMEKAGI